MLLKTGAMEVPGEDPVVKVPIEVPLMYRVPVEAKPADVISRIKGLPTSPL